MTDPRKANEEAIVEMNLRANSTRRAHRVH